VLYLMAVNMMAFFLVAILSSFLAEQLRRKEEELKKADHRLPRAGAPLQAHRSECGELADHGR